MKTQCSLDHVSMLVLAFASYFFMGISFLSLNTITVDRQLALRLHLRYKELVTAKRVLLFYIIMWTMKVLLWALTKFSVFIHIFMFIHSNAHFSYGLV